MARGAVVLRLFPGKGCRSLNVECVINEGHSLTQQLQDAAGPVPSILKSTSFLMTRVLILKIVHAIRINFLKVT